MLEPQREAMLHGIVHGVAGAFPLSSEGHMGLMELLFDVQPRGARFTLVLEVASALAISIVLRKRLARLVLETAQGLAEPDVFRSASGARDGLAVFVAAPVAIAIGALLRPPLRSFTQSPLIIGLGLVGTSAWLLSTHWVRQGTREHPTWLGAVIIGLAQGLAVLPGLSQTAGGVASALWLGLRPDRAFELSFSISLPVMLAAALFEWRASAPELLPAAVCTIAGVASLFSSVCALLLLKECVLRGRVALFAVWTVPVAVATLALAAVWPH
jgi:undecaprenyl-diphosphatase